MKRMLCLGLVVALVLSLCSCAIKDGTQATTEETVISESTEQAAPTATPTPTPTPTPAPTPTPTPVSVYIPREKLPDGRLFEEDYYAVLPGEGNYYNIYDSFGNQTGTVRIYGDYQPPPLNYAIGLFKDTGRIDQSAVQTIVPEGENGENSVFSSDNGFYQIIPQEHGYKVYLYNLKGQYIHTLKYTINSEDVWPWVDIAVTCLGDETVVSFSINNWDSVTETSSISNTIYFIASDGTINDKCEANNLPEKPFALLARKYYIVNRAEYEYMVGDMYDFAGNLVMKDVSMPSDKFVTLWTNESATSIMLCDFYVKDGKIFDSSFKEIEKNKVADNGELIYGAQYDVKGITCQAEYWKGQPSTTIYENSELIAVGTQNNRIAIKTRYSEYVFDSNGASYYGMNNTLLVLMNPDQSFEVISLETGKVIYEAAKYTDYVIMADEYMIANLYGVTYVIDNTGNIRYTTQNADIFTTQGEYILLYRGPYVGIADLNGEWIMKTLTWQLTRDAKFDIRY